MRPRSDEEVASWLAKADEDLGAAEVLLSCGKPLHATVCFHCQQAAEKALKALVVALERRPPRTHDLAALVQVAASVPLGVVVTDATVLLNDFGVIPRYPSADPPGRAQAEKALAAARAVYDAVVAALPR